MTITKATTGIRIEKQKGKLTECYTEWILASAGILASVCWLCGMLRMEKLWPCSLSGIGICCLYGVLRTENAQRWFRRILPLVWCAAAFVCFRGLMSGFCIMANRLFSVSESLQRYEYSRFTFAASSVWGTIGLYLFLIWVSVLPAILYICCFRKRLWIWILLSWAGMSIGSAYFGILPGWTPLILFGISGAGLLTASRERVQGLFWIAGILAVLCCIGTFIPAENPGISAVENQLRDGLAIHSVQYEEETLEKEIPVVTEEEKIKTEQVQPKAPASLPKDLTAPILALLIVVVLLILFIPALINDRLRKRILKNRKGMESKDSAVAVRSQFLYAVKWLCAGGCDPGNRNYGEWERCLEGRVPGAYLEAFRKALPIWWEAAFSSHEISAEKQEIMRGFLVCTEQLVSEQLGERDCRKVCRKNALCQEEEL